MPPGSDPWPLYDSEDAWLDWRHLHPEPLEQARVAAFLLELRVAHGYFQDAISVRGERDIVEAFVPGPSQVFVRWGIDEAGGRLEILDMESLHDSDLYDPDEGPKELPDE